MKIIIGTKNKGKLREFERVFFQNNVEVIGLVDYFGEEEIIEPIEDGKTFAENALIKAKYYYGLTHLPCICDDSGLCVDCLDGAPGVFSARYSGGSDEDNNTLLLQNLKGHFPASAYYECAIVYYDGQNVIEANGQVQGFIIEDKRGTGGFGYDPMFYYPDFEATFAEIPMDQKNTISHRGKAIQDLVIKLKKKMLI